MYDDLVANGIEARLNGMSSVPKKTVGEIVRLSQDIADGGRADPSTSDAEGSEGGLGGIAISANPNWAGADIR